MNGCSIQCKHGKTMLVLFVIALIAIGYFVSMRKGDDAMRDRLRDRESEAMKTSDAEIAKDDKSEPGKVMNGVHESAGKNATESVGTPMSSGSYETYDMSKLVAAKTGKVVLFFRASWCPSCKALNADIQAHLSEIPAGVTILDVDYDSSTDLKKKYAVATQHTLVQVDANGNELKKWVGSPTLSDIVSELK